MMVSMVIGSSVGEALKSANISLGDTDKVQPDVSTTVVDGMAVKVVRTRDEYYTEQVPIPFEHQQLKTDALPEGERRLSQPGENGLEEITYHRILEDNQETSSTIVKSVVVKEAIPEIVMIGNRQAFSPLDIPGKLAYLSAGSAWVMESTTAHRTCVVCTGDLDGRVFSLSPDGNFLLFTRTSEKPTTINTLWAASLRYNPARLIDLEAENIVHYAEFSPDSGSVAFSTAEWREAVPGWQANNDLFEMTVSKSGFLGEPQLDLEANSGGVYGWWGTEFLWHPGQKFFLYARPDSIGLVYPQDGTQTVLQPVMPYQTGGYWAWVPAISWSPDASLVYTIDHTTIPTTSGGEYQEFDLVGVPLSGGEPVEIVKNVGMFANPVASPIYQVSTSNPTEVGVSPGDRTFSLAYLQAIFPDQSDTSGYRLFTSNRDGSNPRSLFPEEGSAGLKPQLVVWSPETMKDNGEFAVAVVYNGNIWVIHTSSGYARQVTGDGMISRIDWR